MVGMVIMTGCGLGSMYFENFVGQIIIHARSGVGMFIVVDIYQAAT